LRAPRPSPARTAGSARAMARGELKASLDVELALDLVAALLYWRLIVTGKPTSGSYLGGVLATAVSAARSSAAAIESTSAYSALVMTTTQSPCSPERSRRHAPQGARAGRERAGAGDPSASDSFLKPARVMCPQALRNSCGVGASPRTASQARWHRLPIPPVLSSRPRPLVSPRSPVPGPRWPVLSSRPHPFPSPPPRATSRTTAREAP